MRLILIILLMAASTVTLSAASINLIQTGWSAGPLTVSFTGVDSDMTGAIELGELTAFEASFVLADGRETTWGLGDIEPEAFFYIDPLNLLLFARNPEFSVVTISLEGVVGSSIFDLFLFPVDESTSPIAQTPEPGSMGLIGLTLLMTTKLLRRKK
jgi:hypothetical protein